MSLKFLLAIYLAFSSLLAYAQDFDFTKFARFANEGQYNKAYTGLKEVADAKFSYEKLHVKYFALGQWASELKKWKESREHLQQAMKYGQVNAAHIHYLIGHTYKEEKDYQKANEAFNRGLDFNPPQNIIFQTRFELSEIALLIGQSNRARDHLKYLERRWRGTPNYPEVIWRLMGVELKDNRRHLACRWARKLYARYPQNDLVRDWGVDLQANLHEGKTIGCMASMKEVKERIRHLNLSGLTEQARREIDLLKSRARPHEVFEVDMLLVSYLENQGYPDEALQILIPYYERKKKDLNYQILLSKVASRAGEFQTAVGAAYTAYKLSPRSKVGKNALFTSAFLSYQIQDYDGASRKFSDVVEKFAGSGLARDARWHLAWLQYLKHDYSGAEKSFRVLLDEKYYKRRRRVVRPFNDDRTRYWLAMSLLKQEKYAEAKAFLSPLANDKSISFYSLVARNRLAKLPKEADRLLASKPAAPLENAPKENSDIVEAAPASVLFSPSGEKEVTLEDSEETLQTLDSQSDTDTPEGDDGETAPAGPKIEASSEESNTPLEAAELVNVTAFRDPRLRERFQRANNLIAIGLNDWAKWELFEIERRTSNRTYLKMLMEAYSQIGSYNRAAYISEIFFGSERHLKGMKEGRDLWEYCYPRAYDSSVENYAKKFNVSESLVLAIMRAESQFNKDALSPVGARGLMQVMPYTATQLAKLLGEPAILDQDLLLPDVNIRLGSRYLSRLEKKFQDQVPLVAAAYNAGPHRVYNWLNTFGTLDMDEFIEHVPYVETRNYMKKVVRNYAIYNELYGNKPATYVWLIEPVPIKVMDRPSPRENWEIID